jgi:hypothetical protein
MPRQMIAGAGASSMLPPRPAPTINSNEPATGAASGGASVRIAMSFVPSGAPITVTFGGVAATTTAISYGENGYIDVTVPAHAAGDVDVVVSHSLGSSSTPVGWFTYTQANLTAGTPSVSPGDNQVTLAATPASGGTAPLTYQWYRKTGAGAYSTLPGATTRDFVDNTAVNGTTYTYKLNVQDVAGAPGVDYAERTVTPGSYTAPTIGFADMENSTSGIFLFANGTNTGSTSAFIIDDPTGLFGGKVLRIDYIGGGSGVDINRSATWTVPIANSINTPGGAFHIAADIYLPAPPDPATWSAMRKLLYINPSSGITSGANAVFKQHGVNASNQPLMKIEVQPEPDGTAFLATVGVFNWGEKHHWEMAMIFNSALGVADGSLRVWKDGALVYEKANYFPWLRATTSPAGAGIRSAKFGEQYQGALPTNESRYFDNLALSTQRIGP